MAIPRVSYSTNRSQKNDHMTKRIFLGALFILLLLINSCNSLNPSSPESLAKNIVNSIKENNLEKFVANYANYDDHVYFLESRGLSKRVEDKLMEGINRYKNKYEKNPRDNFNFIMFHLKEDSVSASELEIKDIKVKSQIDSFGLENWRIVITFKNYGRSLTVTQCLKYGRGVLCDQDVKW